MHKEKGIALFLVLFVSLVLFIVIMGLVYVLGANLRQLDTYDERARAFYLCETAISIGTLDIANGKIGHLAGQWTERTVNLVLDDKTYPIKYTVSRDEQRRWIIIARTAEGFTRSYNLKGGGRRAFPIFIRGFAGK